MREVMIVLMQDRSLVATFLALGRIARAEKVVIYRPAFPVERIERPWRQRVIECLIRSWNRHAVIEPLDQETVNRLGWENNYASDRYVDEVFSRLVPTSPSYRVVRSLVCDRRIDRYYQTGFLDYILEITQFYRTVSHLHSRGELIAAIPTSIDPDRLHRHFLGEHDFRLLVPGILRLYLQARHALRRAANLPLLLGATLMLLLHLLWRHARGSRKRAGADVVMEIIWGFPPDWRPGKETPSLYNTHVLGSGIEPSCIAFYFGFWKFSPEARRVHIERMERLGFQWFDPDDLATPPGAASWLLGRYALFAGGILLRPAVLLEDPRVSMISSRAIVRFLRELHLASCIRCNVLLVFNEYDNVHIMRTIVANRFGRLTVGMHHGAPAAPYEFPHLRYATINRMCLWGERFRSLHGHHWDDMEHRRIGAYRVDWIIHSLEDETLEGLRTRLHDRFGRTGSVVLIQFPSLADYNLPHRRAEMLAGLASLKNLDGDFLVVCRFRSRDDARRYRKELGLDEIFAADRRIVVDLDTFTTYEWVALSDVVIAPSGSTGCIEAACAGKFCFMFEYSCAGRHAFGSYGSDFILEDRHDIVRLFENLPSRFESYDCRWKQLSSDYSYFADGRNLQRFREAILEAVRDAAASSRGGSHGAFPGEPGGLANREKA